MNPYNPFSRTSQLGADSIPRCGSTLLLFLEPEIDDVGEYPSQTPEDHSTAEQAPEDEPSTE